jgi:hypothetical protein
MTGAQRKALVIGISDYTNLQKLDFCKNDGKEVQIAIDSCYSATFYLPISAIQ